MQDSKSDGMNEASDHYEILQVHPAAQVVLGRLDAEDWAGM